MLKPPTLSRPILLALIACTVTSCGANTMYRGIAVASLTDDQLIAELESAARGFGIELNRTAYLMAVRPEPAYVLTSSTTTFAGSARATYNGYVMPRGYGAAVYGSASGTVVGSATTQYQYTDTRAGERLGNAIATAISRSRQGAYRRRAQEVLAEYQGRVSRRRLEAERVIQDFFAQNVELQSRTTLVAAVAPWAAAEGQQDARATLQRTKEIILSLPRGDGLTGTWYGTFAQTSTTAQGEVFAFSEFVRIDLKQQGNALTGSGVLGSGEVVELDGEVTRGDITASVANTTSAINVKLTAVAAPTQITGSFVGSGAGAKMEGTFTLLR